MQSKQLAEGKASAELLEREAEAYQNLRNAEVIAKVAQKNADITQIEGQAEKELQPVLAQRRLFQYLNAKLDVIRSLAVNNNFKIFGD